MSKNPYKRSDIFRKKLKDEIRKEFNRLDVLAFDELSVIRTQEITKAQYDRMVKFNEKEYEAIIDDTVERVNREWLTPEEKKKTKGLTTALLLAGILSAYNPVTQYVYKHEVDRKRMRQTEAMLATKEARDRQAYSKALRKSANLWNTQSAQYGDEMVDGVEMRIMKKAGIKYVQWKTQNDSRVCGECKSRDGEIYPIENAPSKEHYGCRCRLVPYREEMGE